MSACSAFWAKHHAKMWRSRERELLLELDTYVLGGEGHLHAVACLKQARERAYYWENYLNV